MLELRNIHKYYNPGTVNEMCLFEDFNLTINQGEFVSVVGSNGSGKTSMLNIICGSIPVESGQILIDGKDITKVKEYKRNQKIGRVYQNPSMGTCPSMTILENMSLILDEHTAALDPKTAELIMELTDKIVKEKNLTTVMVTHNLRYAVEYGNRLIMMHQGHCVMDKAGKDKEDTSIDEILTMFNEVWKLKNTRL